MKIIRTIRKVIGEWSRVADAPPSDTPKAQPPVGPEKPFPNHLPLEQEKPMRDKHLSSTGIEFPKTIEFQDHEYRRSGRNIRNGLYNYESPQGGRIEVAQVEVKYVTERGSALVNVVDNEAMTDILIKKSSIGSLTSDGLPANSSDRFEVGDVWLICDIKEDLEDPEDFPRAGGACRLEGGTADVSHDGATPSRRSPAWGGNGMTSHATITTPIDPNRFYRGVIDSYHAKGFGFVHDIFPKVHRDPYMPIPDVANLKQAGVEEGAEVSFKLILRDEFDEKGQKLVAWDIRPL